MVPRWQDAKREAYRTLINHKIFHFPVDVKKIISDNEWELSELSKASDAAGLSCTEFQKVAMRDGDGVVFYHKEIDLYHIVYKKGKLPRQRFTLAHEIGHIQLNHLTECDHLHYKGSGKADKVLETEANVFAGRLLAPFTVMWVHNIDTVEGVMRHFGLSYKAACIKIGELEKLNRLIGNGKDVMFPEAQIYDDMYREYWSGKKCQFTKNATNGSFP